MCIYFVKIYIPKDVSQKTTVYHRPEPLNFSLVANLPE